MYEVYLPGKLLRDIYFFSRGAAVLGIIGESVEVLPLGVLTARRLVSPTCWSHEEVYTFSRRSSVLLIVYTYESCMQQTNDFTSACVWVCVYVHTYVCLFGAWCGDDLAVRWSCSTIEQSYFLFCVPVLTG